MTSEILQGRRGNKKEGTGRSVHTCLDNSVEVDKNVVVVVASTKEVDFEKIYHLQVVMVNIVGEGFQTATQFLYWYAEDYQMDLVEISTSGSLHALT